MAGIEVASWISPEVVSKLRALPKVFVVHAASGAVALLAGPLQLRTTLRKRWPAFHKISGRVYVYSVWIASISAAVIAPFFNVSVAAKVAFETLSTLWFVITTVGMRTAITRHFLAHRRWMLRSFALTMFFVTGSLWMDVSRSLPYPQEVTYPIAIFLGWVLNLGAAELWIHYVSRKRSISGIVSKTRIFKSELQVNK